MGFLFQYNMLFFMIKSNFLCYKNVSALGFTALRYTYISDERLKNAACLLSRNLAQAS